VIASNEIRKNHGQGLRVGSRGTIRNNYVHNNGQLGVFGMGDDILVEGNQIFYNNTLQFFPRWEAGAASRLPDGHPAATLAG
jgi:hypothetical protein